jgi:phosphoserine aminotransferase
MSLPHGEFKERVRNFNAGPAGLPLSVLQQCQRDLLNWNGSGASVMELSHRGKEFGAILNEAITNLKKLLDVPDNYRILFMQGGGTAQFAAVPLNLLRPGKSADYVITGHWSRAAYTEAKTLFPNQQINIAVITEDQKFTTITPTDKWRIDPNCDYVHYCDNETIHGVEFHFVPQFSGSFQPILVADMSSNFLSKPIDISKYGLIYAGAQKNSGIAGVAIVIIREDLIDRSPRAIPSVLNYKYIADGNSAPNTPPTWGIYVAGLVFKWLLEEGGLQQIEKRNRKKAEMLYSFIDSPGSIYVSDVVREHRSRMNVTFKIRYKDAVTSKRLEAEFVKEASRKGMMGLEGHRSVGGLRASLYNAVSLDDVDHLIQFMKEFQHRVTSQNA